MREGSAEWAMERPLLARFLAHHDTRCLCGLILATIADLRSDSPLVRKEFSFNDLDLDLDDSPEFYDPTRALVNLAERVARRTASTFARPNAAP